jgi:hypothetical protein
MFISFLSYFRNPHGSCLMSLCCRFPPTYYAALFRNITSTSVVVSIVSTDKLFPAHKHTSDLSISACKKLDKWIHDLKKDLIDSILPFITYQNTRPTCHSKQRSDSPTHNSPTKPHNPSSHSDPHGKNTCDLYNPYPPHPYAHLQFPNTAFWSKSSSSFLLSKTLLNPAKFPASMVARTTSCRIMW